MTKQVTLLMGMIVAAVVASAGISVALAADEEITVKDVMENAHKSGLLKKVANGQASDDEKAQLLALYKALAANEPPQGDADSWTAKTTVLVTAAQAAVDGQADAGAMLQGAANCKACHEVHKPA
ncbi:MAG: hypothetical protein WD030_08840 [Pirellulales bacterium]